VQEAWIEGKTPLTRLSCHRFRSNEVRLWLSVIAYNLGNLWRRRVLPKRTGHWSLTSLQHRLVKTGGRLIKHARYYWLLLAESHLTRRLFGSMVRRIEALPVPAGQNLAAGRRTSGKEKEMGTERCPRNIAETGQFLVRAIRKSHGMVSHGVRTPWTTKSVVATEATEALGCTLPSSRTLEWKSW
jgi:hypothetical protein